MGEATGISWADATFNPWIGCEKVSPGCAHCYAETLVTGRMGRQGTWGPDGTRERTSDANWRKPLRWERLAREGKLPDGTANLDGHRPRVFCASLADVFEPRPELEPWRRDLFNLIYATPALDWLLLTKRPEEARVWLRAWYEEPVALGGVPGSDAPLFRHEGDENWRWRDGLGWGMLPNVWLGVSVENARHTWRADVLREIPAAVRFISAEPLLGSLILPPDRASAPNVDDAPARATTPSGKRALDLTGIDWLIVGGESGGRDARPMHPAWARELRDACLGYSQRGNTAFFFKQWGSHAPTGAERETPAPSLRGFPPDAAPALSSEVFYAGPAPTAGGRLLDGREWNEMPA